MSYDFRQFTLSDEMEDHLGEYIDKGVPPGDFLTAVICNDLVLACSKADDVNLANLPAFAAYLYNVAPRECWGSKEKMDRWLSDKEDDRQEEAERQKDADAHQKRRDDAEAAGDYAYDAWKDDQMERGRE